MNQITEDYKGNIWVGTIWDCISWIPICN
ncbi:hypothetical protein [Flavobacterium palustre]